jgi:hypothetical protein
MNKSNLTNWLSALCVILLIVVLVLQTKQKSQIETLRQEHQAFVTATEQQQKEQRAERETNFREMRQQLDDLVNSGALFADKTKPALEAVALAKAAEQAGDTNMAKIYYLSAVNHAPSEFSHLKNYADIVFRDPAVTTEDFARLKSVLQISLYQIPPASVTNAFNLLNETMRREEQLLAAQTPRPVPVNWQERFDQLTNSITLENSWADLKQISRRWNGLNEIIESLHEEQPDSDLTKQVERELELTQRVLAAARIASTLDTMMAALNLSSEQPEKAVSLLQTAEATLGQLWGIDSRGWPAALQAKADQYPKSIQSRVEIVAEFKSRPYLAIVEAERDSAKSYVKEENWKSVLAKGHPYQGAITNCDSCYERAAAAAQNISSAEGRKKAEAALKEIRDIALDAKRKQFDAYQTWAITRCEIAFNKFWGIHVLTRNDCWDCFYDGNLGAIDQSLLSPEVNRTFNDVMEKLTTSAVGVTHGMDGANVFSMQKQCAEAAKKKLEDF